MPKQADMQAHQSTNVTCTAMHPTPRAGKCCLSLQYPVHRQCLPLNEQCLPCEINPVKVVSHLVRLCHISEHHVHHGHQHAVLLWVASILNDGDHVGALLGHVDQVTATARKERRGGAAIEQGSES